MRVTFALVASLLACVATACESSSEQADVIEPDSTETAADPDERASYRCRPAPRSAIATISLGLREEGWLAGARYVEVPVSDRNAQGWPEWFVAAPIRGAVGVWATSAGGRGPIMAIDDVSARASTWGTGAHPISQAWKLHAQLREDAAARAAAACVGG